MGTKARIIKLSEDESRAFRFLADRVDARLLAEGKTSTVVTITRTGTFYDPRYGTFDITKEMLLSMVKNFDAGVFGQDIVLDVSHKPADGAAGFFKRLFLDGNKLRGEVELTEYGIDAIKKRGFIYLSAEFNENFQDNELRKMHGPTLLGAALTPRPAIKHLDRVQLSEDALDGAPMTLVSERITKLLNEELQVNNFKKLLLAALAGFGLDQAVITQLGEAFETSAKSLGEDEAQLKALSAQFEQTGKTLAESIGGKNVTLSIQNPTGPAGLTAEDVNKLLADNARTLAEQHAVTVKKLSDNQATFKTVMEASEPLKTLSEPLMAMLLSAGDLITGEMTEAQVKALAEHQVKLGAGMGVNQQLTGMGYQVAGNARITVDDSNSVKSLQETADNRLGITHKPDSERFANTDGKLQNKNKKLADEVLARFDAEHAVQLRHEHKMLSGGEGSISDTAFPVIAERTVIRESLYSLTGLQFVNSGTMQFGETGTIPYSYRDKSAAGKKDTRRYEGQEISRAGVIQTTDTIEPIPQKLSFSISDELRYLTQNGLIDFNAASENVMNAARIIGEDTDTLLFDEVLNSNDEFGAVEISNESISGTDIDGTNNVFVLAYFPVVRPRKRFTLKGVQIGNTLNPFVVEYNSGSGLTAINEYDGTGEQSAGDYYVVDYNQGEIYITNELGAIQTPGATDAIRVSYSRATNNFNFDINAGAVELGVHWNAFLYRYGLLKTEIQKGRNYKANFGLTSETAMNQIEQAKQFIANYSKPGTDLSSDGSLGRIKSIPNFDTTAPGLAMADDRLIIGERAQTRFRMMKPWSMGKLQDQRGANGRFTGQKEAYGDQFIVVHTPAPLKNATTAITLFDSSVRAARAE